MSNFTIFKQVLLRIVHAFVLEAFESMISCSMTIPSNARKLAGQPIKVNKGLTLQDRTNL
jgi:hypothetical protein